MPRIAVVDDQPDMRQQLCSMIDQYSRENNCMLEVTAFSDGSQVITNYCKGFDIIFLDIEMPELGGMDAAERIRTVDPDVVLVFVTNMAQYAIRGYEVDALDFVLKPVNYYQFSTKLARALQRVQRRKGGQIALQTAGGVQLLNTEDIYWLETRDRMLHYHTSTGVWSVRSSLQNAEKQLAPYHFANATSVTLSICGMCGRSRTIWSRLGRTGWRSAAASGLPSWLRSPPMLGVPCNAAKSPTISFSSCLWDTALGRSTDLLAPAPALAALLAAGAALPDSLHSPFHIFIMGGLHAFLAVPAGGGVYSVLYVDDFCFPQLHPVGLVRRQLLRHLGNFECPDDI